MKILVLNYEYPPLGGGAGVITQNIAERMAELGHQVTVITTWFHGEEETEKRGNLTIIRLKSKRQHTHKSSVSEMLSWIKYSNSFLNNYCRKETFDMCFANFAIPGGIVAINLKRKFGLKYTIISHGHDIPWRFPKQMRFFHMATYFRIKKICIESEANFMQTAEMMQNINKFLGKNYAYKNVLIPNGMDINLFKPDYSKRNNKFKIVYTGRLVEQKDPLTFLNAIKLYARKNRDLEVCILGDGVLLGKMKEFVNADKLNDIIKFYGWVSKPEMVKQYQSAHVSVVTSVFEGMSISVLESLACGCFLISTPIDGINEVITSGENGVIVDFHSAEDIAHQLDSYYNERFLKNYTIPEPVMSKLITRYDWNNIVPQYEKVFKNIVGA